VLLTLGSLSAKKWRKNTNVEPVDPGSLAQPGSPEQVHLLMTQVHLLNQVHLLLELS